jgi:glycosyltransferase involved in cell wall biosynthesis
MTSPGDYPRVLVLAQNKSQPFTGGGVILTALFSGFPADRVMFLHRDVDYDRRSTLEEHRLDWRWLRLDGRALWAHLREWLAAVRAAPRAARLDDVVGLLQASCWFQAPRAIDRRIRAFRPDVLYAWAGDSLWARTLSNTADRYGVPFVIHFMDNHVDVEPQTPRDVALASVFRRALSNVASRAAVLYTISDSMGVAYRRYWNRPHEVYRGANDLVPWTWSPPRACSADDVFRIGFTGSTDRSQIRGLAAVAAAIDVVVRRGTTVRLVLYLTEQYERAVAPFLRQFTCVEFRRHPDLSSLRAELLSMDALILAYAFDHESEQYYRYSFATKIVAYMLSGRPILAHGPKHIEPIAYAVRTGALLLEEPDDKKLAAAIERFIADEDLRNRMARTAWETGRREHDRDAQAARFVGSLRSVVQAARAAHAS